MDFEEIYIKYFKDIYNYVRGLSGDEHVAEDITAETFFKAMNKLNSFRGDCETRVWLCKIAKNTYFSYVNKNRKENLEDITAHEEITDNGISVEDSIIQNDVSKKLRLKLHELKEPYKEVFMWRVFGELSFKQIGQLFNKTENWACVTYHRAKKIIQNEMEDNSDE